MSDELQIVVCLKQVLDPEAPGSSFKIASESRTIGAPGVPPVINPYDESALELALRLKDAHPGIKISAITFGPRLARPVLMKSLAVGADELYLIEDASGAADGAMTAAVLAAGIRKIGYDLVLTGRQASDTNSGSVGLALAELLGLPAVSWARRIELEGEKLKVEKVIPGGCEVLRGRLPALITVSHEAGEMRRPKLTDIRKAKQKPIIALSLSDLEMDQVPGPAIRCVSLEAPRRQRACRLIEGETPEAAGKELARVLCEKGLIL